MSRALSWLEQRLGWEPHTPAAHENMAELRAALDGPRAVLLFGAGGAGRKVLKALSARRVEVAAILDNGSQGELNGIPVLHPEQWHGPPLPIVIASSWFVEIAAQLQRRFGDALPPLYPVPDVTQLESRLFDDAAGAPFLAALERHLGAFAEVEQAWEDHASRRRFVQLLAYRLAFFRPETFPAAQLPTPTDQYHSTSDHHPPPGLAEPLAGSVLQQRLNPYYAAEGFLQPRPGDHVIDGGAWIGDTAFWYLEQLGAEGRVWAFEPDPHSFSSLVESSRLPAAAGRIVPLPLCLGSQCGEQAFVSLPDGSPSSHLGQGGIRTQVTTIDHFVEQQGIGRIDVIKFDLEGADLDALEGARATIHRWRPDLAVSIYHHPEHLAEIPLWIQRQGLGYRLRLVHNHPSINETVCLATVRGVP